MHNAMNIITSFELFSILFSDDLTEGVNCYSDLRIYDSSTLDIGHSTQCI